MHHENINTQSATPENIAEEIAAHTQPLKDRIERGGSGAEGHRRMEAVMGEVATIIANNPERVALDIEKRAHDPEAETTVHDPAKAYIVAHAIHKDMKYIAKHKKRPAFLKSLTRMKRNAAEKNVRTWTTEAERAYDDEPFEIVPGRIQLARDGMSPLPHSIKSEQQGEDRNIDPEQIKAASEQVRGAFGALMNNLEHYATPGTITNSGGYITHQPSGTTRQLLVRQGFVPDQRSNDGTPPMGTYVRLEGMPAKSKKMPPAISPVGIVFMDDGRTLVEREDRFHYNDSKMYPDVSHINPLDAVETLNTFAEELKYYGDNL